MTISHDAYIAILSAPIVLAVLATPVALFIYYWKQIDKVKN